MTQVYLHIGMPKTGTSALQQFLLLNRERLSEQGIHYPEHDLGGNGISSGNGEMLVHIAENHGVDKAKNYLNRLKAEAGHHGLLLSSEFFFNYPELMHEICPEASIILYYRNPITLLESSYNQAVKRLGQVYSFSRMLRSVLYSKDPFYTGKIALKWRDLYGNKNILFRVYESSQFIGQDIYDDFLGCLECVESKDFNRLKEKVNVSYSPAALEIKRSLNGVMNDSMREFQRTIDVELQRISNQYSSSGGSQFSLYSEDELAAAQEFFRPYNEEVARAFQVDGRLFKEDYCLAPDHRSESARRTEMMKVSEALIESIPGFWKALSSGISVSASGASWTGRQAAMRLLPLLTGPEGHLALMAEANKSLASLDSPKWFGREQLRAMADGGYQLDDYYRAVDSLSSIRKCQATSAMNADNPFTLSPKHFLYRFFMHLYQSKLGYRVALLVPTQVLRRFKRIFKV